MGLFKKPWEIEYASIGDPVKQEKARQKALAAIRRADGFDKANIAEDASKYTELRLAAMEGLGDRVKVQARFATNYTVFPEELRAFARAHTTDEAIIESMQLQSVAGWAVQTPAKHLMFAAVDPALSPEVRRHALIAMNSKLVQKKDFDGVPQEVVQQVYQLLKEAYPRQSWKAYEEQLGLIYIRRRG